MPIVDRFTTRVIPRNQGSINIARSAIDGLQPAIKQQYDNSLSVNARPIAYYMRKVAGKRCTCSTVDDRNPDGSNGLVVLPGTVTSVQPEGYGSDSYLGGILTGTKFSIDRYGTRPDTHPQYNPNNNLQVPTAGTTATQLDAPFATNVIEQPIEDFIETPENNTLVTNQNACGVCLNTGFVGGYDPFNMLRQVYDAQYLGWTGTTVDTGERPNKLVPVSNVTLAIPVPRGVVALLALKVWNNKDLVSNVVLSTYNNQQIPQTVIQAAGGTLPLYLDFSKASSQTFTHLEIMYDIGNLPLYAEWSKLTLDENLEIIDQISDVSVILSPSLPQASLYDIIVEDVFNRSWKIANVNTNFDREKHVGGWNVTARVLQSYEIYNLLPHLNLRTGRWGNRVAATNQVTPGTAPVEPFTAGGSTPYR